VQYNPHSKSWSVRHDFLTRQPIDVSEIPLEQSNQRLERGLQAVDKRVKTWTQPTLDRAIKGVVSDLFRSRTDLIAENAFLRQQVIILNRQKQGRAQPTSHDRRVLVFLAHHVGGWKDALHIVKLDTCDGYFRHPAPFHA
jgi:hypothetical protein